MFFRNKVEKIRICIPYVKKVLVVASGKGGVGKSTIAGNIALSLTELGYNTGLLDADIYGPSIPKIFNIKENPRIRDGMLIPLEKYGLKLMSIGFLVSENSALVWRGPMLTKAIHQLFKMTLWGTKEDVLDYLIVDTPPGTGDIHLSIAQNYKIDSSIIITTPQILSLIDAFKAVDMFKKLKIDIFGIIENMAYLINSITNEKEYIFGKSDLLNYCNDNKIKYINSIPISKALANNSLQAKDIKDLFKEICKKLTLGNSS